MLPMQQQYRKYIQPYYYFSLLMAVERELELIVVNKGFWTNTASDLEDCNRFSQYKVPKGCAKDDAKLFVIKYFWFSPSVEEAIVSVKCVDVVVVNDVDIGITPAVYDKREIGSL